MHLVKLMPRKTILCILKTENVSKCSCKYVAMLEGRVI